MRSSLLLLILTALLAAGCYSLSGISIDPTVRTYYVDLFDNRSPIADPDYPARITEDLKEKVRTQTRLVYTETDPDIEFGGAVTGWRVTSEAPTGDQQISFNRLTIDLQVEYTDNSNEANSWKRRFSFFSDFSAEQNLLDVQETLLEEINELLVEDIFNKAFTNW